MFLFNKTEEEYFYFMKNLIYKNPLNNRIIVEYNMYANIKGERILKDKLFTTKKNSLVICSKSFQKIEDILFELITSNRKNLLKEEKNKILYKIQQLLKNSGKIYITNKNEPQTIYCEKELKKKSIRRGYILKIDQKIDLNSELCKIQKNQIKFSPEISIIFLKKAEGLIYTECIFGTEKKLIGYDLRIN